MSKSKQKLSDFILIKGLESNSASSTDIWVVKEVEDKKDEDFESDQEYIMKVFIEKILFKDDTASKFRYTIPVLDDFNLLNGEISIYQLIKKQLINNRNVRNIVPIKTSTEFNSTQEYEFLVKSIKPTNKKQQQNIVRNMIYNALYMLGFEESRTNIKKISSNSVYPQSVYNIMGQPNYEVYYNNITASPSRPNTGTYSFVEYKMKSIVTPYIKGSTFHDYLKDNSNTLTPEELMRYVYILLVTNYQMSEVGINQNDLHWQNILMDANFTGSKNFAKKYFTFMDDNCIYIDLKYTLFIYDFDRAVVINQPNKILKKYQHGGNCPEFHKKRDFLKTLCILHKYLESNMKFFNKDYRSTFEKIKNDLMNVVIQTEYIRKSIKKAGDRSCWLGYRKYINENTYENFSVYCEAEELEKGIADRKDILNWCLSYTGFDSIDFSDPLYYDNLFGPEIKIIRTFLKQTENMDIDTLLEHNIQYVDDVGKTIKNRVKKCFLRYK